MSDLDLTVTISDGDLSDLALTRANGYRIGRGGFGPGARSWRRQREVSPFVAGGVLVGAVLDVVVAPLHVRIVGSTSTQFETRLQALMSRMEQPSYVLQVDVGGMTCRWLCEPADSALGSDGAFDEFELALYQQIIRFTVPRQPVPLDGPL